MKSQMSCAGVICLASLNTSHLNCVLLFIDKSRYVLLFLMFSLSFCFSPADSSALDTEVFCSFLFSLFYCVGFFVNIVHVFSVTCCIVSC